MIVNEHAERTGVEHPEWPEAIVTRIWTGFEDGQFFAIDETFDISTVAPTREAAIRDVRDMVCEYINSRWDDGAPFSETVRRIPLRSRARLMALALGSRVSSRDRRVTRASTSLPRGSTPAHC